MSSTLPTRRPTAQTLLSVRKWAATAFVLMAAASCSSESDGGGSTAPVSSASAARFADAETYVRALADCVEKSGAKVVIEGPAFNFELGTGMDQAALGKVVGACESELGPMPAIKKDPATANEVYDLYVKSAECLRARGKNIPDAPSREAFVDEYTSGKPPSWDPYIFITVGVDVTEVELAELQRECPAWKSVER